MGQDWPGGGPPPLPGAGGGGGGSTPWERRDRIGFVGALFETTKQVLTAPGEFFRAMPVSGGIGAPLGYGVIVGYVGLLAQAVYDAVFRTVAGSAMAPWGSRPELERFGALMGGGLGFLIQAVLGPVLVVIGLFVASGIFHVMLLLLGSARRDFEATVRVGCYGEAAALFGLVPICGGLIGAIYQIVLWIIGLSEAHGISKGRAAAAVLIPIALVCCCCVAIMAIAFGGLAAALGQR
jgi:hypothetical protein